MSDRLKYICSILIFGTSGMLSRFINVEREFLALSRALIGSLFILLLMRIQGKKLNIDAIKNNLKYLIASGMILGISWICLFIGFKYSLSITSLLNNMAPILVIVIMALFFREVPSKKQLCCVIAVLIGILMIFGLFEGAITVDLTAAICGLETCLGYAIVILINKKIKNIDPIDKTVVQLGIGFLTVLPFVILGHKIPTSIDARSLICLIIIGVVNMGIGYPLYFGSISSLPASEIAIIGYLEPVINIILGAALFSEKMSIFGIIGTIIVLVAACING